jgi:hypothetical protein
VLEGAQIMAQLPVAAAEALEAWSGQLGEPAGAAAELQAISRGESVIKCPSPLNMLKDTYTHNCY